MDSKDENCEVLATLNKIIEFLNIIKKRKTAYLEDIMQVRKYVCTATDLDHGKS